MIAKRFKLKNPLFQFFVIGGLLFAIDFWNKSNSELQKDVIFITNEDLRAEVNNHYRTWGKFPDSLMLDAILEREIEKEILFRKGKELKLDVNDQTMKEQLALITKQFILARVDLTDPGDSVLISFKDINEDEFINPAEYSFEQYFFEMDQKMAKKEKTNLLNGGRVYNTQSINLETSYKNVTQHFIAQYFGLDFSIQVKDLEPKDVIVLESIWGWHLVKLNEVFPERIIEFKQNRHIVLNSWRMKEQEIYYNQQFKDLKREVVVDVDFDSLFFFRDQP